MVGQRLRTARQQRRLTLAAVEALLGGRIPARLIAEWETGEQAIPVEAAAALAAVYEVPLVEILTAPSWPGSHRSNGEPPNEG